MPKKIERRSFVSGVAAGAIGASAINPARAWAKRGLKWKMATAWSPQLPVLQDGAEQFAKMIARASDKKLQVKVYAGGELIPPLEIFDAVSSGTIEMGVGASYYWAGKVPAAQFFSALPFGLTAQQQNGWLYGADGLELWRDLYKSFDLVPFAFGNTGAQMGGWFKKALNTLEDLKGLKIRIPGLGGKVMAQAGANVVLMPGSELYTALERGTIDATDWTNPYLDERLGLHRAAKNYYYPSWHEPGTTLELLINKKAWDGLSPDLQEIISSCAAYNNIWTISRFEAENGPALSRLTGQHKVNLQHFPSEVLKKLKSISVDVVSDLAKSDPAAKKIHQSYTSFKKSLSGWTKVGDKAFLQLPE